MTGAGAILIVEDDDIQAEYLKQLLGWLFPRSKLTTIRSEKEFMDGIAGGWVFEHSAIVLDCHLPWSLQTGEEEYDLRPTRYRAAIRCLRRLRLGERGDPIPVVVRTLVDARDVLPELEEFGPSVEFVGKKVTDDATLIELLTRLLTSPGS